MPAEQSQKVCRICFEDENSNEELISPCMCRGSSQFIHESCLRLWIQSHLNNGRSNCEVCKYEYKIEVSESRNFSLIQSMKTRPVYYICACSAFLIIVLLVLFFLFSLKSGYANPSENTGYFIGILGGFVFSTLFFLVIIIRMLKGICIYYLKRDIKIFPFQIADISSNDFTSFIRPESPSQDISIERIDDIEIIALNSP